MQTAVEAAVLDYQQRLQPAPRRGPFGLRKKDTVSASSEVLDRALEMYNEARGMREGATADDLAPATEKFAAAIDLLKKARKTVTPAI